MAISRQTQSFLSRITLAALTTLATPSYPPAGSTSPSAQPHSPLYSAALAFHQPLTTLDSATHLPASKIAPETTSFPLLHTAYTHCYSDKYAAIIMDAVTGDIVYGYHHHEKRYPASITKMMTACLVFDALDRGQIALTDTLRPDKTPEEYKTERDLKILKLAPDETLSVKQALDAMCVVSAADATDMLATHVAGDTPSFVAKMNQRAAELGMTQTHFTNTTGAPDTAQTSTARDMAILMRALMQYHPHHMETLSQTSLYLRGKTYKNYALIADHTDMGKTGYIFDSGFNVVNSGLIGERRYIFGTFGGRNIPHRARHEQQLQKLAHDHAAQHAGYADSMLNQSFGSARFPKQLYRFDASPYQRNMLDVLQPRPYVATPSPLRQPLRMLQPLHL